MADKCDRNEEKHAEVVSLFFRGKGCTRAEAEAEVIAKLLDWVEGTRKVTCEKCECGEEFPGNCVTTIDDRDMAEISKKIAYFPYKNKECPKGVGWIASASAFNFKSICFCVPK